MSRLLARSAGADPGLPGPHHEHDGVGHREEVEGVVHREHRRRVEQHHVELVTPGVDRWSLSVERASALAGAEPRGPG